MKTTTIFRNLLTGGLLLALLCGCAENDPCADDYVSPLTEPQITIIKGTVPSRSTLAADDIARLVFTVEQAVCGKPVAALLVEHIEENNQKRDTLFYLNDIRAESISRDTSVVAKAPAGDTLSYFFRLYASSADGEFNERLIEYEAAGK